jgi:hypothetical protein
LAGLSGEVSSVLAVLRKFTAEYNLVAIGTEDACQRSDVEVFGCLDQSVCSLLRSIEHLRPAGVAGTAFVPGCCAANKAGVDRHAHTSATQPA